MKPRRTRRALLVIVATASLAGCAGQNAVDPQRGNDKRYIAGAGVLESYAPGRRLPAPRVEGELLDGPTLSLQPLKGKVVVLNFWASWCPPCRAEAAALEQVYAETQTRGVAFVGVNSKDGRSTANAFIRAHNVSYPSYYDQPGRIPLAFHGTLPPVATPSTLVRDRRGRIAARVLGPVKYRQLKDVVERVATEPGGV